MIEVIDDFLPLYNFNQLQSTLLGSYFDWYFNSTTLAEEHLNKNKIRYRGHHFTHRFYKTRFIDPFMGEEKSSQYFSLLEVIISKLKLKRLVHIKANLGPRTLFHRKEGYHIDIDPPLPGVHKTAILYMNTCNGWTEFEKGGKVKSVENRIVIFDSNLKHQGVTCTNEQRRVLINFNYEV